MVSITVNVIVNFLIRMLLTVGTVILLHGTLDIPFTCFLLITQTISFDLPLHIRFLDAKRHDSVGGIVSLSEFRKLNPDIPIKNLCLDSANDFLDNTFKNEAGMGNV